jgi:integrase
LAALRHLFDWLVTGQVIPINPAASVRGPRHSATKGKTPALDAAEARQLLDSIDTATPAGLRDRALIALMVFSFARVGAALGMSVADVYTQNRRLWVRLREKGGKRHEMPCHHTLEAYLHAYLDGTGIGGDPKGPLFRTIGRGTGRHRDQDRQPHLPGHRHHRLPDERRHAGERGGHGKSCQHPHHPALRPPARRNQPGRGGKSQGVMPAADKALAPLITATIAGMQRTRGDRGH